VPCNWVTPAQAPKPPHLPAAAIPRIRRRVFNPDDAFSHDLGWTFNIISRPNALRLATRRSAAQKRGARRARAS
jgi:hypothetical protein